MERRRELETEQGRKGKEAEREDGREKRVMNEVWGIMGWISGRK